MFYNQEVEQALLGRIILNNHTLERLDQLQPNHFYFEAHQKLFQHLRNCVNEAKNQNVLTLKAHFQIEKSLIELGGSKYIKDLLLAENQSPLFSEKDYARNLVDLWQKRELFSMIEGLDKGKTLEELKNELNEKFEALESENQGELRLINNLVDEVVEKYSTKKIEQVKTSFSEIDQKVIIEPGNLIIIAGRASMGKSTLALNLAKNISKKDCVILYSLEMSGSQIASKFLSESAGVNSYRLRFNNLNQNEQTSILARKIENKLIVYDQPAITLGFIRSTIKQVARKVKLKAIFVDHVHIMTSPNKRDSRERQIAEITAGLKAIAKEFGIVVFALCQLNRDNEKREDKRPTLSDLRDSGSIEQDADVVMFVHRDQYYLERMPENPGSNNYNKWLEAMNKWSGKALLSVAKNRDGEVANIVLKFDSEFSRFSDLD